MGITQKEKARHFEDLYDIYCDEFNENSEVGECAMDRNEFAEESKEIIREGFRNGDYN